jgi:hypothetical protein
LFVNTRSSIWRCFIIRKVTAREMLRTSLFGAVL